jgi:hypothetical protein
MFSPIQKLHMSVIYGWGVIFLNLINWWFHYGPDLSRIPEYIIWVIILLSIRYSTFKPLGMAGTIASGFMMISLWDYITGERNTEYASPIFFGILVFIFILFLVRGAILCSFYLLRETYYLIHYYRRVKNNSPRTNKLNIGEDVL